MFMDYFLLGFNSAFYIAMMFLLLPWGIVRVLNFFYDIIRNRG